MLPDYFPPILGDGPKIRILKNARYQLVAPTILKGVRIPTNIIPNLKRMTFVYHNLRKFPGFAINKYMVVVRETEDGPKYLVLIKWDREIEKVGLLSVRHTPHFKRNVQVKACVQQ